MHRNPLENEMLQEYREWKAMGEGGTSHSWSGYLSNLSAEKTMAFEDTMTPDLYHKPEKHATGWSQASNAEKAAVRKAFLPQPLPQRQGPQARAKKFVFPQREKNAADPQDPKVQQAYQAAFAILGEANAEATEWKTSALEKHGTAFFLKQSIPLTPLASPSQREICHIHTSDMSGHVTLSLADAQEVIKKGWGEIHRLSGTDWIHLGYTMLYVPRNVEETEVFRRILQAGVDYMRSG